MAERAVVNASPLIFLSRAGLLDLLQLISSQIVVPEIVVAEIEVRGKSDPKCPVRRQLSGPAKRGSSPWERRHPCLRFAGISAGIERGVRTGQ